MKVKLIAHTTSVSRVDSVPEIEHMRDVVAYCARVSNPSNQMNHKTADKLLNYLAKHAHWSPFEMVSLTFEIETTRDIARQILRHRSFTFQEFSQRYADPTKDLGFETRECRMQDPKNRQNSIEIEHEDGDRAALLALRWEQKQEDIIEACRRTYQWAIENGIAKEQARAVLPEGLTLSRMYVQGTLRSWIHYCQLRSENGTQKEHMEIAKECAKVIFSVYKSDQ